METPQVEKQTRPQNPKMAKKAQGLRATQMFLLFAFYLLDFVISVS